MDDEVVLHTPDWFEPHRPIVVARAPARLDVMGGIADYSGATVLELPLSRGVVVAVQRSDDGVLHARTDGPTVPSSIQARVRVPGALLSDPPAADAPRRLRGALDEAGAPWASYVLGPLAILRAAGLLPAERLGLRLSLWSDVPVGAGISSSAALEVAALRAFQSLFALDLAPLHLVTLAQQAEHQVALAPCGIMDQATSALGQKDHLLMLRCQPATVLGQRRLPRGVQVVGIDSGVAHRVAGTQYGRVRTAAFMGRAMISALDAHDPPAGYLCNLPPAHFAARYEALLPEEITGSAFLARYGATGDAATRVEAETIYRVRACTTHPVLEQANVTAFLDALDRYEDTGVASILEEAGAAMYRSHDSYGSRCGLGTPETDTIVDLVRELGPEHGLFGAKITGGGAGGTVAVLGSGPRLLDTVGKVAQAYQRRVGHAAHVIHGSSDGALARPIRRVTVDQQGRIDER